jgi:hypothetical protein
MSHFTSHEEMKASFESQQRLRHVMWDRLRAMDVVTSFVVLINKTSLGLVNENALNLIMLGGEGVYSNLQDAIKALRKSVGAHSGVIVASMPDDTLSVLQFGKVIVAAYNTRIAGCHQTMTGIEEHSWVYFPPLTAKLHARLLAEPLPPPGTPPAITSDTPPAVKILGETSTHLEASLKHPKSPQSAPPVWSPAIDARTSREFGA